MAVGVGGAREWTLLEWEKEHSYFPKVSSRGGRWEEGAVLTALADLPAGSIRYCAGLDHRSTVLYA